MVIKLVDKELDGCSCSKCGHKFRIQEGRYAVNGATCVPCYDNTDITVDIAGHPIPQKLLNAYAEAVEAVRRGAIISNSRVDPLILLQREQNRITAHKRIFEFAGIKYGDHYTESTPFQTELSNWLDDNTT